jgi:hypothetical protein
MMLTAYFDDSGTHTGGRAGPSRVVVVAGITGTEGRLTGLERAWKKHLVRPICGRKESLKRFHATECDQSLGEFNGWSRTETDHFCYLLREEIIDSGVAAYGIAVTRKDWDDLITGDARKFLGDAEGYCISQCFVRAIRWAQENTFDPQMRFVFDNRTPEIHRRARTIGDAFERHTQHPSILDTTFLNSSKVVLLQAADMIAWEVYQHALEILANNGEIKPPSRQSLRRLAKKMWFNMQIAQRHSIQRIADYINSGDPELLSQAGEHFTMFDPSNPDYSHLSKGS